MNIDVNYPKNKYLKYKNKYLKYKNQNGGIQLDNDLTKCLDVPNYSFYDPSGNRCCQDKELQNCYKFPHNIDYEHKEKTNNRATVKDSEIGNSTLTIGIDLHIYDNTKIKIYRAFKTIDNKIYSFVKVIGKGAFGLVAQYYNDDVKEYFAVKYGDIAADLKVIEYMKERGNACSGFLVKYQIHKALHEGKEYNCIIMEHASGTLADLIPKINQKLLIDIVYAIMIAIKCLYDIKLFYIDIKPQNILYYYTDKGINIILGDLGGIIDANGSIVTSIKPPDIMSTKTQYVKTRLITWGLGRLILLLLGIPSRYLNLSLSYKNPYVVRQIANNTNYLNEEIAKINSLVKSLFPAILPVINLTISTLHEVDETHLIKINKEINKLRILANKDIKQLYKKIPDSLDPLELDSYGGIAYTKIPKQD